MTFPRATHHTLALMLLTAIFALAPRLAPASPPKSGVGPSFKGPVGLQLYSLRADFARDVPGTLALVKNFGFQYVELAGTYSLTPEKYRDLLTHHGLQAVSGHFPYERFRDHPAAVAQEAATLGLRFAGCAWIPHQNSFTEADCRAAIEVFNRAGKILAQYGIKFFYHTHGYEFQPHAQGTLFDLLATQTNPKWVAFEMDVFWIVLPGQDPVKLLEKYGSRFALMHVKDMKLGVKTGDLTGHTEVTNDVPLGTGQMPWPTILRAAKKAGVKFYFIEDESPTAAQQIPQSIRFLEQLKW